ncbi:MAG: hypothetical protein ACRDY6_08920 [Acidimicrobiia bacterium]
MLLWYVGLSVLLVHYVFRSSGIDYRLVAVGSVLPLAIDVPSGRLTYGHTLVAGVALLFIVMVATIGQPRLLRRRLICLPIGYLCGLVLSGVWAASEVFWWPFLGRDLPHDGLLPPIGIVALEELAGLAACVWAVVLFGLTDRAKRDEFLRSGRLREASRS